MVNVGLAAPAVGKTALPSMNRVRMVERAQIGVDDAVFASLPMRAVPITWPAPHVVPARAPIVVAASPATISGAFADR